MSHYKCARNNESRLYARQLTKQSRDREPYRLPLKRIVLAFRDRKNRSFLKHYFSNSAPTSSFLNTTRRLLRRLIRLQ